MQQERYINITQQAKLATLGELSNDTKQVWIVLHGYGQLSQYFIRKFRLLSEHGHFVVAPEATSRFYLNGHDGRVGATWMTKEDRLQDIENYTAYLNHIYDSYNFSENIDVTVVGFSQGAATASRWLASGYVRVDRLLLWSGIFPPDLDVISAKSALMNTIVYNLHGTSDPYLSEEKLTEQKSIVDKLQIPISNMSFDGGHDIMTSTLSQFL
jgi:predicted esterase